MTTIKNDGSTKPALSGRPPEQGGHCRPRFGLSAYGKLDLCRGLLASLVVLCHAFATSYAVHPRAANSLTPTQYAWLDHTVNAGFVWVMGFFVISGYCIHLSVARRLSSSRFSLRGYMIARVSRILPLYYAALAFAVIVDPWITPTRLGVNYEELDISGLLGQVFLVQNLTHCFGSFTTSWSLTNEVFYYFLYGILAAWLGRIQSLPFVIGLVLCIVAGGLLQLVYFGGNKSPLVLRTGMLFGLGFNWFLGVGVAVWRDRLGRSRAVLTIARSWPLVLAASFAGYHWGLRIQFAYVCSGIAFALLLIRIVAVPEPVGGIIEPAWATRFARFAGLASYPTYLFHSPFMWLLATLIIRSELVARWETMMAILFAASMLLGSVLGWFVERPIMEWRSGFLARVDASALSHQWVSTPGYGIPSLRKESS